MICLRTGCGRPGVWIPVLSFAAKVFPRGPRCTAEIGLAVCHEHALPDPDLFLTDAGWKQIMEGLRQAGKAEPDRSTVTITFREYKA